MFGIHRNFPAGGGGSTSDATAEQWDIKNGKTAYIASGKVTGSGYFPGMVKFDGSTGYYANTSATTSGNKVTVVCRFNRATFTGGSDDRLFDLRGPTLGIRAMGLIFANDHATTAWRRKVRVLTQDSSGTNVCILFATSNLDDGENHTLFYEFDGDAGTAVFRVDGNDEDDTGHASRIAPTTGTLQGGASSRMYVGAANGGGGNYYGGNLGFFGYRDVGGLAWSDFMQTDGSPKNIESTLSTVWGGGVPLFWHESGKMDESATPMTKNGTITLTAASSWS